ncbi:MAG: aminotransferase class IV [Acidimicrobiales bacterium]
MPELVWINGAVVSADDATISVFDHGLTVGDGVFETLKAVAGEPFAVRRHLERLRRSASALGLEVPVGDHELRAAMTEVLASHALPLARVRITVTGGAAPLGSERGPAATTIVVAAGRLGEPAASTAVCVAPWPRNERGALAGVKTTSYAENVVALAFAKERGCSESIVATTTGLLCEGTGSNVFVVVDGELSTPPLSSGCLAGVTRELVLEITDAIERDIPITALLTAEEVFLTSTGRDVQAVHQVDDRTLPGSGPHTARAHAALSELMTRTFDP